MKKFTVYVLEDKSPEDTAAPKGILRELGQEFEVVSTDLRCLIMLANGRCNPSTVRWVVESPDGKSITTLVALVRWHTEKGLVPL